MGKYFTNETLDGLWTRLVNATKEITGSSLSNAGIKGIHDALLSHYGLSHENTPTTPGDYMKGIAVAARYKKYGTEEPHMFWSLKQIVEEFEKAGLTFTLNDNFVLTASESFAYYGDLYLVLYKDNEIFGSIRGADGTIPFNFLHTSSWADDPPPTFSTGTYYATIAWYSDEEMTQYNSAKSNEIYIVYTPQARYTVTLNANGDYSLIPSTGDATLVLYDVTTEESQYIISAGAVDSGNLSEYMTIGHQYYIEVSWIWNDPDNGTYRSETITYQDVTNEASVSVVLNTNGIATATYTNCTPVSDATWTLYSYPSDAIIATESASGAHTVDFSGHMQNGSAYYVIISTPIEDGEVVSARSNTIEYAGSTEEPIEAWISISTDVVSVEDSENQTYQFTIYPTYGGPDIDSSTTISYTIKLYDDTDSTTLLTTKVYENQSIDNSSSFDVKDLYSAFYRDSYYIIEVTAITDSPVLTASDTAYFTWNFDSWDADTGNMPDLSNTPMAEWIDQNIYISNYSDSKYNNIDVLITDRYWDTAPEPSYETIRCSLNDGYVYNNNSLFEGYPYDSTHTYTLQLYYYDESTSQDYYSEEITMERL